MDFSTCTSTSSTTINCNMRSSQFDSTGKIGATYGQGSTAAALRRRRNLHADDFPHLYMNSTRRDLATANADTASINNPIICINVGESMMFTISNTSHYPSYNKNSILNSNSNFDYGYFLSMASTVQAQALAGNAGPFLFGFTFDTAGSYVFTDSTNTAAFMMIVVTSQDETCPDSSAFAQPATPRALSATGVQ